MQLDELFHDALRSGSSRNSSHIHHLPEGSQHVPRTHRAFKWNSRVAFWLVKCPSKSCVESQVGRVCSSYIEMLSARQTETAYECWLHSHLASLLLFCCAASSLQKSSASLTNVSQTTMSTQANLRTRHLIGGQPIARYGFSKTSRVVFSTSCMCLVRCRAGSLHIGVGRRQRGCLLQPGTLCTSSVLGEWVNLFYEVEFPGTWFRFCCKVGQVGRELVQAALSIYWIVVSVLMRLRCHPYSFCEHVKPLYVARLEPSCKFGQCGPLPGHQSVLSLIAFVAHSAPLASGIATPPNTSSSRFVVLAMACAARQAMQHFSLPAFPSEVRLKRSGVHTD